MLSRSISSIQLFDSAFNAFWCLYISAINMLSRGNSTASNRLQRAKSKSSVHMGQAIPHESRSTDPETARHDALTAAHIAFDRAQERAPGLKQANHDSSGRELTSDSNQELSRKQSVRFTGPSAVPLRQRSITRRQAPAHTTPSMLTPQINCRSSSIRKTESEEYVEDGAPSIPSSYRRIRKSKSMYTPRKAPSVIYTDGTPPAEAGHSISNDQQLPGRSSSRKSTSFLRGRNDYMSRDSHELESRDAAIEMARDQYLRQLQEQRLKERPSFLHPVKRRKSQKAFRRTVRTSSTNSYGSAISSSDQQAVKAATSQGLGRKARALSLSLKDKLKRVFRKSSQMEEGIPTQQLEATRAHFRDYFPATPNIDLEYKSLSPPNGINLRRINSRTSSLHSATPQYDKENQESSIRSVGSDDSFSNARSRVTSWTNSTVANTVATRDILMDKNRLSIIQENGTPHQLFDQTHPAITPSDGRYAVFRKPLRNNSNGGRVTGPVNSQRVYSALMRKLEQKIPGTRKVEADYLIGTGHGETNHQPCTTSIRPTTGKSKRTSVISQKVCNPSEESLSSVGSVKVSKRVVFNPLSGGHPDEIFNPGDSARAPETLETTPQEFAERSERLYPQRRGPLREVRSSFFPPSTRIESLKISPYRRAVQASSEDRSGTEDESYDVIPKSLETTPQLDIGRQLFRRGSTVGFGSIYSRTTGGNTPGPLDSYVSLAPSESGGEPGTAVIITNHTGGFNVPTLPAVPRGNTSAKSSNEWKTWMASEVAGLGNGSRSRANCSDDFAMRENGHNREYSQINGDDVQVGIRSSSNLLVKQPLAIIHGNLANRPALRNKSSDQMSERFPVLDVGSPPYSSFPNGAIQHPGLLPRSLSNNENERYPCEKPSMVPAKSSQISLHSQAGYTPPVRAQLYANANARDRLHVKSSSSLHSRPSPERAARLKRMQSAAAGLKEAADRQFGSVRNQQRHHWPENQAINGGSTATLEREGMYEMYGAGLVGRQSTDSLSTENLGMVDAFLNRRRVVMGTSEEGDSAGAVFL